MTKCKPVHNWAMPAAGDDALVCLGCGRRLCFMDDINPNMRGAIVAARERHYGPAEGEAFRAAFDAAFEDARRRFDPPARPAGLGPSSVVPTARPRTPGEGPRFPSWTERRAKRWAIASAGPAARQ